MRSSPRKLFPWLFAVMPAVVLTVLLALLPACRSTEALIDKEFSETFEREDLGPQWRTTGGDVRLDHGELVVRRLDHHPVWLKKRLPANVSVEFDSRATGDQGDIRIVLFGDGKSVNPASEECSSSGYLLVFGGWKNSVSAICRGAEAKGSHLQARHDWPVVAGRDYHHYITRKGGLLSWFINGHDMLTAEDPQPLGGPGHEAFGFDGGSSEIAFDNLTITPLTN